MTVSLIVSSPKSDEYRNFYIPLATEEVFRRIWLTAAKETNAFWLPMFETGVDVSVSDFEEVSGELNLLRRWVEHQPQTNIPKSEKDKVLERIEALLKGLNSLSLNGSSSLTVFIG
ncbi:hypothetical protein [Pseudoduganella sp. R-43]|uniref:hypothetical protein n=1 Tax=Pseudoduganella sp. R-43 TaxID=3404063 RepID=UPI003CF5BA42